MADETEIRHVFLRAIIVVQKRQNNGFLFGWIESSPFFDVRYFICRSKIYRQVVRTVHGIFGRRRRRRRRKQRRRIGVFAIAIRIFYRVLKSYTRKNYAHSPLTWQIVVRANNTFAAAWTRHHSQREKKKHKPNNIFTNSSVEVLPLERHAIRTKLNCLFQELNYELCFGVYLLIDCVHFRTLLFNLQRNSERTDTVLIWLHSSLEQCFGIGHIVITNKINTTTAWNARIHTRSTIAKWKLGKMALSHWNKWPTANSIAYLSFGIHSKVCSHNRNGWREQTNESFFILKGMLNSEREM